MCKYIAILMILLIVLIIFLCTRGCIIYIHLTYDTSSEWYIEKSYRCCNILIEKKRFCYDVYYFEEEVEVETICSIITLFPILSAHFPLFLPTHPTLPVNELREAVNRLFGMSCRLHYFLYSPSPFIVSTFSAKSVKNLEVCPTTRTKQK